MLKHIVDDIYLVEDPYGARIPRCHCLYIEGERTALIDTSSGPELVNTMRGKRVDMILSTHFHEDHILNHTAFPDAEVWAHPLDAPAIRSPQKFCEMLGFYMMGEEELAQQFIDLFQLKECRVDGEFKDGQVFDLGHTRVQIVHTPGHSAGHCAFYFPRQDILYTGDIDLTRFGPWYGGLTSDIDQFFESARRFKDIQPGLVVSAHRGLLPGKELPRLLDEYMSKIQVREERILKALEKPQTLEQLTARGLMYDRPLHHPQMAVFFEKMWLLMHLQHLIREGVVGLEGEVYFLKE